MLVLTQVRSSLAPKILYYLSLTLLLTLHNGETRPSLSKLKSHYNELYNTRETWYNKPVIYGIHLTFNLHYLQSVWGILVSSYLINAVYVDSLCSTSLFPHFSPTSGCSIDSITFFPSLFLSLSWQKSDTFRGFHRNLSDLTR